MLPVSLPEAIGNSYLLLFDSHWVAYAPAIFSDKSRGAMTLSRPLFTEALRPHLNGLGITLKPTPTVTCGVLILLLILAPIVMVCGLFALVFVVGMARFIIRNVLAWL
jgi:hypothetical protein